METDHDVSIANVNNCLRRVGKQRAPLKPHVVRAWYRGDFRVSIQPGVPFRSMPSHDEELNC